MKDYQLGFIPNETIFNHVKQTVELYRAHINLKEFNKNIIDPIKLTFDSKVYGKTFEEIIEAECIRQIDKTNSNRIGYFHQNLFRQTVGRYQKRGLMSSTKGSIFMPNLKTNTTR